MFVELECAGTEKALVSLYVALPLVIINGAVHYRAWCYDKVRPPAAGLVRVMRTLDGRSAGVCWNDRRASSKDAGSSLRYAGA